MIRSSILFILFIFLFSQNGFGQNMRNLNQDELSQIGRLKEMTSGYQDSGDIRLAAKTSGDIAFIYWKAYRLREAVDYFKISAELYLQANILNETKNVYSNIGVLYTDMEELEFAYEYFDKSLKVRREIGKPVDISAGLIDVSYILQVLGFYDRAIENLNEALDLATKEKSSRLILNCYQLLSLNLEQTGNIKKANEYAGKAESFQAFLQEENLKEDFNTEVIETRQEVAKSEAERDLERRLYEAEQKLAMQMKDSLNTTIQTKQDSLFASARLAKGKQLEIDNLEKGRKLDAAILEQQKQQQQKQRLIILFVAVGLLLMIVLAMVMLRANRARQKANTKLEKQNKEIAEKSEQINTAIKKIAHQNQNITQSINYAQGIQRALLPQQEQLTNFIEDSFIFFQPRDIVSGDFYWFREIDAKSDIFKIFGAHRKKEVEKDEKEHKKFIISAVDCTGHGVPGAFMSMIGFNLLDEITNKGISRPDLILEELHRGVRFTLKQKETNNQDGMDMAVCVVDKEKKIVEFAGAKNPLVYIQNGEVTQIKGDKFGIGGKSDDHSYNTHVIKVDQPTSFYMFSDGYIDQFGGEAGRKFMIKNFRVYLKEIHNKPMNEQKTLLDNKFKEWVGTKYSQIDDVLVVGFKLDFS